MISEEHLTVLTDRGLDVELVDRLEKMIRDKVAAKQAAEANTIARG